MQRNSLYGTSNQYYQSMVLDTPDSPYWHRCGWQVGGYIDLLVLVKLWTQKASAKFLDRWAICIINNSGFTERQCIQNICTVLKKEYHGEIRVSIELHAWRFLCIILRSSVWHPKVPLSALIHHRTWTCDLLLIFTCCHSLSTELYGIHSAKLGSKVKFMTQVSHLNVQRCFL